MNSKERLGARVGLFAILTERLGSLGASVKCTVPKKSLLEKTFPSVCTNRIRVPERVETSGPNEHNSKSNLIKMGSYFLDLIRM